MIKPTVVILEGNYLGLEIARELKAAGYPFSIVGHSPGDMALQSKKGQWTFIYLTPDTGNNAHT